MKWKQHNLKNFAKSKFLLNVNDEKKTSVGGKIFLTGLYSDCLHYFMKRQVPKRVLFKEILDNGELKFDPKDESIMFSSLIQAYFPDSNGYSSRSNFKQNYYEFQFNDVMGGFSQGEVKFYGFFTAVKDSEQGYRPLFTLFAALGDKVNQNSGSMGVAFSSCTVPAAGKPTFELGADEMEFGVGIHGEPGRRRDKIKPAQDITNELLEAIIEDLKPNSNDETLLFVNGMGGTPLTELYLVFDNAKKLLDSKNIKISRSLVGNYCTSLEMQGASITLTKLDEEIAKHWDSKVHTAAMRWGM